MRKFALILMLLTLLIPASGLPAGVGDDCEFRLDHVYTMDRLELSRLLDRPACRHLHPEALQRLDEIVVAGVLSGEYSRTVLDGLAWLRATGRLRVALDAEDLPAALAALTTLEADLASHASQASVAELTLFGMTLPVPVGAPPRYGASVERFMDAEDIARYLEPLLKAGVDDGSGHQALQWVERSP
jgi:hypothetical protein